MAVAFRAGIAATPETSEFTAAYERIAARHAVGETAVAAVASAACATDSGNGEAPVASARDGWLSPVPDGDVPQASGAAAAGCLGRRASNRGFLPLALDDYLALLDWTGRQLRRDKRGSIPADLRPILERLSINAETWVDTVSCFGRWFHRVVGRLSSMSARAGRSGKFWFQGRRYSRLAFG